MKNKNIYKIVGLIFCLLATISCEDFLDKEPDNRTALDSPKKITQLLVNAYPDINYAPMAELSGDNFIDNRAPNSKGISYNVSSFNTFGSIPDEAFAWDEIQSGEGQDSPYEIWSTYYQSIAITNHILEAIKILEEKGETESLNAQKGEALILRAYCHFILANLFCLPYKDATLSQADLGIPYVTEPETEVGIVYERNSLAEVYELIKKDIEEGIDLIDDNLHSVPKYHFNKKAANAFAAKFFLFKREYEKVVDHATAALGTDNVSTVLRNWSINFNNPEEFYYDYISVESPANLLVTSTISWFWRYFVPSSPRYGHNESAFDGGIGSSGPTWSSRCGFLDGNVYQYNRNYGVWYPKISRIFEYTDKVALTGQDRIVRAEFTTDAVLLDRAEAYIFLKGEEYKEKALADLQAWNKSHKNTTELTEANIKRFYVEGNINSLEFHTSELSPDFTVTAEQKPFIDCVLHFRRLERLFDGDRWFDIKRYGIELTHYIGTSNEERVLTYNDPRRAFQIPAEVTGAGLQPNPRPSTYEGSENLKYSICHPEN